MNSFLLTCIRYVSFLFILLWQFGWQIQQANATHALGADLTYTCLGGNQYQIDVTLYADCGSPAFIPANYNVGINSASCGVSTSISVSQVSIIEITPLCPLLVPNSSCNGGPLLGVMEYTYSAVFDFPANCSDWVLTWVDCCRSGSITNSTIIPTTGGTETYLEANLDNLTVSCNSSPIFTSDPITYICAGEPFLYNHGAYDPDGDSLVYELINPLETDLTQTVTNPVAYVAGFSPTYPISTTPPNAFGFDPLTGQFSFTPDVAQQGIVTVLVREYRNGQLIGSVMRDLQVIVTDCPGNNLPVVSTPANVNGGTLNGNTFTVCAGNTLSFQINAADTEIAQALTSSDNLLLAIPGASITSSGLNPLTLNFSWPTTTADVGIHSFVLTVNDGACAIPGRQTVGFEIYVQDQVEAIASQASICPGPAQAIQLNAFVEGSPGNGTFSWTPTAGLSNPNIANPVATVTGTQTYTVNYSEGVCNSSATATIQSIGDLIATPAAPVLCNGGTVQLDASFSFNIPPPPGNCGPGTNICGGPTSTVQVGTGTNATGTTANAGGAGSPYLGNFHDGRTQVLFRASELNAAGVIPGIISQLELDVVSKFSTQPYSGFTIRMGCTTDDEITTFAGGLTQVFNGNITTAVGANTYALATPYEWDGTSNLILEFCFDNTSASGFDHVVYTSTNYNSVAFNYQDNTTGCTIPNAVITNQRPNVRFTACPIDVPINFVWTPVTGLTNPNIPNPIATPTVSTDYVVSVNTPGCNFTDTVFVTVDQAPSINPIADIDLCQGESVQLNVTGTSLSVATFAWNPTAGLSASNIADPIANPATTTTYTVTATNACGTDNESFDINVLPAPTANLTSTDLVCNGDNSGSITANIVGGTPAFTYAWTPAVGVTPTVTNLAAGNYTLVVSDQNNCTDTVSATITEPTLLTISTAGQNDPVCNGGADGDVTFSAGGGTGALTYSIDGTNFQASPTFTNLTTGVYVGTVRDANGCEQNVGFTLNDPLPVNGLLLSQTDSDCINNTGSFSVNGEGGTAPYLFSIDNGANFFPNGNFNNLGAGIYTVTIQDANGCVGTIDVAIAAIGAPTASLSSQINITCPGGNDGSLLVTSSGGTPPLSFSIDGTNFFPTGTFNNLTAGNYIVTVQDANNCPDFLNVTLTEPPAIQGFIGVQADASCPGSADGSFTMVAAGGTSPYEFSLDGFNFSPSGAFSNLTANTYTVTIRDANGCLSTEQVIINEPPPILGAVNALTDVDCNGATTGSVTFSGSGGVVPYEYSLDGVNYQTNNTFINLPAANYTGYIRDANGCVGNMQLTISEPPPLAVNIDAQTNVLCNGNTNGAVTVSGQGGTPVYTYSIDGINFAANGSFSGLAAGSYTVTIRDNQACEATIGVNITEPLPLTVGPISQNNLACNGDSSGAFTLQGSGGTAPYQYSVGANPFSTTAAFTNLDAGNYTIAVQDANGCTSTSNIVLTEPAPLNIALNSITDVLCNGAATGVIDVTGSNGTAPYEYSTDGTTYVNNGVLSGLIAGPYTVYVRDANGCVNTLNTNITEPAALTLTGTVTADVSCNGGSDGAANVVAAGGVGGYTYNWNPGGFNTASITNAPAANYTVSVTDGNSCVTTSTVTINEPAPIVTTPVLTKGITCFGDTDAEADVTATGGTPGYTFVWSSGTQTGSVVTNLPGGTHYVTVTDNLGCQKLDSVTVIIPSPIATTVIGTDASCFGLSDGSLTASPTGGVAPFTFEWNNNPALNTSTITNQAAGFYQVVVTDNGGCTDTASFTINQPAQIALTTAGENETCTDANGLVSVLASGGAGGFSYAWNTAPVQTTDTAVNVPAGTYQVIVTDMNGCQDSAQISIIDEAAPALNSDVVTDASCFGASDGSATVLATGGTGTYTYTWNTANPVIGPALNGVPAGIYTVTVDDGQCQTSLDVTIGEPDELIATIDTFQMPSCFGDADGSATVAVSGGTMPYTYAWNTGIPQTTPTAINLVSGTYGVLVRDVNGCQDTATLQLMDPPQLEVAVNIIDVLCFGGNTGQAEALVTGGVPPYSYDWTQGSTQAIANSLIAGLYTIDVTDANGCVISAEAQIAEPPLLTVSAMHTDVTCFDGTDGTASLTVGGGVPGYTYEWSSGSTLQNPVDLPAGSITVIVRDQNNCESTTGVEILQPPAIVIEKVGEETAFCDLPNGAATVLARGGNGGFSYSWNTSPPQLSDTVRNIFGGTAGGPYVVTVTDIRGCQDTLQVSISNDPPAIADFITQLGLPDTILKSTGEILFENLSQFAVTYSWDFGNGSFSDDPNPSTEYLEAGDYTVILTAFDPNFSCPDTFSHTFTVVPDGKFYIANAFTPNGDGINDSFTLYGEGVVSMEWTIFDRWGRVVRRFNSLSQSWDGRNENGQEVQEGVYVYKLSALLNNGHRYERGGTITLIR